MIPWTCLCDAGSVQQLQAVKREEPGQHFDVLHVGLAVASPIVLLCPVEPGRDISTQVSRMKAAHFNRVEKNSKCGQK